eukprot:CAMPEP_0115881988 /NCGR_PEP_ID=MMETSP0287-20121206/28753_1 /TAXON_ID=412157 /ORGANISM="Chrysochromulina rotalis, Strain UIO044" /LENGTH=75 /DNA_ID=CAMNT_0003338013 /DNA_START=124 /DNA_END=351 /DNA_ORIENTATION=+
MQDVTPENEDDADVDSTAERGTRFNANKSNAALSRPSLEVRLLRSVRRKFCCRRMPGNSARIAAASSARSRAAYV